MATVLDTPEANTPTETGTGVRCRSVVKEFGSGDTRVRAVDDVTVDIGQGEMTLLIGPSGCGKTTLISMIAGLLTPTKGDIELFGTPQSELPGRRLVQYRAQHVGFVFQQYNLLPALTAVENVAVPLLIQGVPRPDALQRSREVLELVDLGARATQLPTTLSGGQQQRVAIARALVHQPRLLVCDEPTAALDAKSGHTVMELIRQVAVQSDRVVIVVTHDHRVFDFADRTVEMADGRVQSIR